MERLVRTFVICLLAIAVVANLTPSFAASRATMMAGHTPSASEHDHHGANVGHGVGSHFDHADCPHDHGGNNADDCNDCCGVCINASVMPVTDTASVSLVVLRDAFWTRPSPLSPYGPPLDPDIPKPLI